MSVLVLAEHDNAALRPATLNVLGAAKALGAPVSLLVAGSGCEAAARAGAQAAGVAKVLHADAAHLASPTAEALAGLMVALAPGHSHILAAATATGKSVAPRVAALLDVAQISEIVSVQGPDTFVRLIYAGSAVATVRSADAVKVITVRTTNFEAVPATGGSAPVEAVVVPPAPPGSKVLGQQLSKSDRPELTSARVVVSGGRALASGEKFKAVLEPLAAKLNAALGASRAAVDAGFVPNDFQVGQTGKVVAPDLYIAVGISGAIQHLAGMKDAKVIVAINKDPEAPIFQVADYGLVGDLFELVPQLTAELG